MVQSLANYFSDTFSGQLTNALFIGVIYALIVDDLRKIFADWTLKKFQINSIFWKITINLLSFIPSLVLGLIGVFCVVFFLWLLSLTF